jgi:hypothetical protein
MVYQIKNPNTNEQNVNSALKNLNIPDLRLKNTTNKSIKGSYAKVSIKPILNNFWSFEAINSTISNFSVKTSTSETILISWGDGNTKLINSGEFVNHTYI